LWMYLKTYKPAMMLKMIVGTIRVARQYKEKIKEAKKRIRTDAPNATALNPVSFSIGLLITLLLVWLF